MIPAPGESLGPYEIVALLGVGGMGQVFRARDTRLNRDVALKFLPDDVAQDPDRLARFRREAQLLAALNHPQIAAIYGLEESGGVRALVLELVEGPTLEEVIARSKGHGLPLEDALPIARQIAEALETAHDQGIVHRDLKPANIKLRSDAVVKVLDFGLAKALQANVGSGFSRIDVTSVPTLTSPAMTMQGIILGTAAYMSPEQAKGRESDRRTDIWAFGCVFFEMLTGQRAFDPGESVSEAIANVLKSEPDWSALPADTPASIRRLLRRCLAKDPQKREPHIGAVRLAIEEARESAKDEAAPPPAVAPSATRAWRTSLAAALVAAIVTAAAIFLVGTLVRTPPSPTRTVTFDILPPDGWQMGTSGSGPPAPHHAVSPDGDRIAFVAYEDPTGSPQVWVRRLADFDATVLRGTESAQFPFWSADGRSIGFFADAKLKKIDAEGGPVTSLADVPTVNTFGGTWNADDDIVFSPGGNTALLRVSATSGGTASPVTTLEENEFAHRWPQFLPDGRRFLYLALAGSQTNLYVASLDSPARTLVRSNTYRTAYSQGHLLSVTEDATLTMQPFDPAQARTTGEPRPLIERVGVNVNNTNTGFSVSESGVLVFREGVGVGELSQMYWVDRDGRPIENIGEPHPYSTFRLSPDERSVIARLADSTGRGDWHLIDLARGGLARRLTFTTVVSGADRAAWSPDAGRVVFGMSGGLFLTPVLSPEAAESLYKDVEAATALDWSPDARSVLFARNGVKTATDMWMLSLETREARPFLETSYVESSGRFSPDGKWIAFSSNKEGASNVYVMPSDPSDKREWKISVTTGANPRWRGDGKELFFHVGRTIFSSPIRSDGSSFQPETPQAIFTAGLGFNGVRFEPSADGQRFLVADNPSDNQSTATSPLTVVLNWRGLIRQ